MNSLKTPSIKQDITSGFLVFLIALPLSLGIAMASGFPPVAGVLTAIIGGLVATFLGSARLTIKGPAAGMIVIVIGAVTELSQGDPVMGYRRALAVGVVAGVVQVLLAVMRAGVVGELMPSSVVHGMLSAIGLIIIAKQAHTVMGVTPEAKEPLHLFAEIPHSLSHLNPEVFLIGLVSLAILFGMPLIKAKWAKLIPGPLLVLALAVPLGLLFNFGTEHDYLFNGHVYHLTPKLLIRLPGSLLGAVAFPDFSMLASAASIKYIIMFTLVGSIESLLTVTAVDTLDPKKRTNDLNRDLLAVGIANTLSAAIGGLPMISEIVRSKANIDNGAKSAWANFFHGVFLLLSVALIPNLLQLIPLAALAAMLIFTGARLASPSQLKHVREIGPEQLLLFVTTMLVTLMTDLLIGVGAGLVLKVILHLKNGAPFASLFRTVIRERREGVTLVLEVHDAAVFTNYLGLSRRLKSVEVEQGVRRVVVHLDKTRLVDHTVLEKLHGFSARWSDRELVITGLDGHRPMSKHPLAARRRVLKGTSA